MANSTSSSRDVLYVLSEISFFIIDRVTFGVKQTFQEPGYKYSHFEHISIDAETPAIILFE